MITSPLWFTLTLAQCIQIALAIKGDSACERNICVDATVEGDIVTYELTPMLDPVGWVAVGFGSSMINTHSVIMWKNEDGSTTLSQRYASDYAEPRPVTNPPRVAKVVEPKKSGCNSGRPKFAFQIPVNHASLTGTDPREPLVFAYSPIRPDKDPESSLTQHQHNGFFMFDLTKEFIQAGSGSMTQSKAKIDTSRIPLENLIIGHGFLVSLGFLVVLPAGSLIARWGRSFTPKWFEAHWLTNMAVAFPIITFGVLLGPAIVHRKETYRIHFANTHEIAGAFLLLAYYTQVLLGRFIHQRRLELAKLGPITQPHPPQNILHIGLGITIITLAFFQVRSGLGWWETITGRGPITPWALPLWHVWIVLLPILYFAGYALLPRQLRQEREVAYASIPVTITEENSQTDRLLVDEEEF